MKRRLAILAALAVVAWWLGRRGGGNSYPWNDEPGGGWER